MNGHKGDEGTERKENNQPGEDQGGSYPWMQIPGRRMQRGWGQPLFSDWTRGSRHKLGHRRFPLNFRKQFSGFEGGEALAQVAQRSSKASWAWSWATEFRWL